MIYGYLADFSDVQREQDDDDIVNWINQIIKYYNVSIRCLKAWCDGNLFLILGIVSYPFIKEEETWYGRLTWKSDSSL